MAEPSRIAVIVAHPDDAEFGCAGSVAKWIQEGARVSYVIATNGDKGSGDRAMTSERLARIREEEQRKAAEELG
jgi:LmbE family N-acetylglucosaminyl deacetylase